MPTRSRSARSRTASRTTRAARTRSRAKRTKSPLTVAAKSVGDQVSEVRRHPGKPANIGKIAAVAAAGLVVTRLFRKKK